MDKVLQDLMAQAAQAQMGEGATYAGGMPLPEFGIETLLKTNYGVMLDINQQHAWFRILAYITPKATYGVGLVDMKVPPEERFTKHYNWKTELCLCSANTSGSLQDLVKLFQVDMPELPVVPPTGMLSLLKHHKEETLETIAQTIIYRDKKAAVAWTPQNTKNDRKLKIAKRAGLKIMKRKGITVAVLRAKKGEI